LWECQNAVDVVDIVAASAVSEGGHLNSCVTHVAVRTAGYLAVLFTTKTTVLHVLCVRGRNSLFLLRQR
jgi:hypothetical protein